jgi:hypothetical protein
LINSDRVTDDRAFRPSAATADENGEHDPVTDAAASAVRKLEEIA